MRHISLALAITLLSTQAFAQSAPPLQSLDANELGALTPAARRGMAIIVRDAGSGTRAQTTIMTRSRAPLATLHDIIAAPERYGEFMDGIDRVQIESRFQHRIAFRMHTSAGVFSADTVGSIHVVNAHRIDGTVTQSQIGPGDLRWDLYPDGDGTLVALTTRADPSSVNWVLRAVTRGDTATIAGVQMSFNGIVVFAVSRRAEALAGNATHGAFEQMPTERAATEPPAPGPWMSVLDHVTFGALVVDAERNAVGSTVATRVASPIDVVLARLHNVADYPHVWPIVQDVSCGADDHRALRFGSTVATTLFRTEGDQERAIEPRDDGSTVRWRGLSGDYAGVVQRWDLVRDARGGTVVMLTGGRELQGAGLVLRTIVAVSGWLVGGYSVAWKMLWLQPLVAGL